MLMTCIAGFQRRWHISRARAPDGVTFRHRLFDEFIGGFRQQLVGRFAINRLAADFQHHGNGERRNVVEFPMGDSALNAGEHIAQSLEIEQPGGGVGARRAQQDVVGLMLAQHVVDEVGREQHLAARFLLAGEAARDQPRDQRAVAKGALHQRGFRQPCLKVVAEHVGGRTSAARSSLPCRIMSDMSPRPQTASAYSLATKPSGRTRARSSRRVSSMPSVWCASRPSKG